MSLTLVAAPPAEPITLEEAKAHLRLDTAYDDTLVGALITAARMHIDARDGWLGRCLVQQTWDLKLDGFPRGDRHNPCGAIEIPQPPLQSVTSISYVDMNGDTQVHATSRYQVDLGGDWRGRIIPVYGDYWPVTQPVLNAVTVRFVAGYAPDSGSPTDYAANIPKPVKQALLLLISHWYENRTPVNIGNIVSPLPMTVEALLMPYRAVGF